jgi:hypothetical protein
MLFFMQFFYGVSATIFVVKVLFDPHQLVKERPKLVFQNVIGQMNSNPKHLPIHLI